MLSLQRKLLKVNSICSNRVRLMTFKSVSIVQKQLSIPNKQPPFKTQKGRKTECQIQQWLSNDISRMTSFFHGSNKTVQFPFTLSRKSVSRVQNLNIKTKLRERNLNTFFLHSYLWETFQYNSLIFKYICTISFLKILLVCLKTRHVQWNDGRNDSGR